MEDRRRGVYAVIQELLYEIVNFLFVERLLLECGN